MSCCVFDVLVAFLSGESPSSSASDVDNLNNPSTVDKVALPKGVSSPQVAGNHVIAARNRPNFLRMLNFVSTYKSSVEALICYSYTNAQIFIKIFLYIFSTYNMVKEGHEQELTTNLSKKGYSPFTCLP